MRLILLLLPLLLLIGCATNVPIAVNVVDECKSKYFGEYYGNCIWEKYEFHPNTESYLKANNYRTDWKEITLLNEGILIQLEDKTLDVSTANEVFMYKFTALVKKDAQRINDQQRAIDEQFKQLGELGRELSEIAKSRREAAKDDTPTIKVKVI